MVVPPYLFLSLGAIAFFLFVSAFRVAPLAFFHIIRASGFFFERCRFPIAPTHGCDRIVAPFMFFSAYSLLVVS